MFTLPLPTAFLEGGKMEHIMQPQHVHNELSLSNGMGGLVIDTQIDDQKLPSIHHLLNDHPNADRRLSVASLSSSSSGSSTPVFSQLPVTPTYGHGHSAARRLHQVSGHIYPYPTPHTSPVQTKCRPSFASRRSPQPWRYAESSSSTDRQSARSRESSEQPASKKAKTRKQRNKKAEREFCGRQELSVYMSLLQNYNLVVNPNLPTLAAPRPDVPNGGWRPLKSNNINKDVENPLVVNKTDILTSSILIQQHSNLLFKQVDSCLRESGIHDLADRLAHSVALRGCGTFCPLQEASPLEDSPMNTRL